MPQKCLNTICEAKRDGVINPQNYNFNQLKNHFLAFYVNLNFYSEVKFIIRIFQNKFGGGTTR